MVSVEPKDTRNPNSRIKEDLLLAASKKNTRDPSQSSAPHTPKIGEVLS